MTTPNHPGPSHPDSSHPDSSHPDSSHPDPNHPDPSDPHERWLDLLAERALFGLDSEQEDELRRWGSLFSASEDAEQYERMVAMISVSSPGAAVGPLPDALRKRIRARAAGELAGSRQSSDARPAPSRHESPGAAAEFHTALDTQASLERRSMADGRLQQVRSQLGHSQFRERIAWLVAAASLLFTVSGVWQSTTRPTAEFPPPEMPPAARRLQLMETADDLIQVAWQTTDDPAARNAAGDLVWSPSAQEGYMTFRGLAANDPDRQQYQLWLVDPTRDDKYPVDGGVFDVRPASDGVVVPIRAKLPVNQPIQFVVTIEQPGGVVVSRQERVPLLAKLP